jgi:DNA-directed RNA polymerase I subunit RPA12
VHGLRFNMSVVGSLIFCDDCGNLLDSVTGQSDSLDCGICGQSYAAKGAYNGMR